VGSPASCRISVPGSTQVPNGRVIPFAYWTITIFGWLSHTIPLEITFVTPLCRALQPQYACILVWAFPRSLATTEGMFSFPLGTEMFQFPRFPSSILCVQIKDTTGSQSWVSPFGYPRINACLRLPEAFRSIPRPSSALDAKASTRSPY
jgi:hypothetical protein